MREDLEMSREEKIEALAWKKAKQRAAYFSEREGMVQIGLKWKRGIVNQGIHKTPEDYIEVCRQDALDEIADQEAEAQAVAEKEAEAAASSEKAKRAGGRYVELLANAERLNLNHGKSWVCGELDIETKGAHPAWEGELICYVYK